MTCEMASMTPGGYPLAEPTSTDTDVQVLGRHRRYGPRPRVFMKLYRAVRDTPVSYALAVLEIQG